MKRVVGITVILLVLLSLSVVPAGAEAIRMIEEPSDPGEAAMVSPLKRPEEVTGGLFFSNQSGNVNITTGEINGSVVTAAGSLNLFPQDVFDKDSPLLLAGRTVEDGESEEFINNMRVISDDLRNNAVLTALGGVNILASSPEEFPQDVFEARQFPSDVFTLNTGDIQSSQVFATTALNFIPGGIGDLTATQQGTFEANLGNITEGSTVTLLGAVNITTPSGTNFPQDVFSGTEE